jgi:hypothetical protein
MDFLEKKGRAQQVAGMRKNGERKKVVGALVRKLTMQSNARSAERSQIGDPNRVSHYCSRRRWEAVSKLAGKLRRQEKAAACDD